MHRDIKPDNIIVADGKPYLVDFGLSFNKNDAPAHGTPSQDELGNRFCRLPELSVGSGAKRDPRSDVTFCAGILLYVLTAKMPAVLIDEEGRMPHQRDSIRNALESNLPAQLIASVLALFDRSFQMRLSSRWETAAQFRGELKRLLEPPRAHEGDVERLRAQVHKYADQPHVQHSLESKRVIKLCSRSRVAAAVELGGAFGVSRPGHFRTVATWLFAFRASGQHLWVKFRSCVGSGWCFRLQGRGILLADALGVLRPSHGGTSELCSPSCRSFSVQVSLRACDSRRSAADDRRQRRNICLHPGAARAQSARCART